MLLIAILLKRFMKNRFVKSSLRGIKTVAIALIAASAITLLSDFMFPVTYVNGTLSCSYNLDLIKIFILVIAGYFLVKMMIKKKPTPVITIVMAAVIGLLYFYIK